VQLLLVLGLLALCGRVAGSAEPGCLSCHGQRDDIGDPKLVVDVEDWKRTVHGAADVDCATCHAGHEDFPHEESNPAVVCGDCRPDAVEPRRACTGTSTADEHPRPAAAALVHARRTGDAASPAN
jgi:hypothetical protein